MISVFQNIMLSIGKNITHKAKGKTSTSIWALVGQDDTTNTQMSQLVIVVFRFKWYIIN